MEYTIYNAAMNCPELWADGAPALNLHLGISAQNAVQMFWPWQEDQLTQVFCSAPGPGSRWKPGMCTTMGNFFIPNIMSEGRDPTVSQINQREAASLPLLIKGGVLDYETDYQSDAHPGGGPVPAGPAGGRGLHPEEALGEVNIYSGGYSMNYLTVNGRVHPVV